MNEELGPPEDLKLELRRLRLAFGRLQGLEPSDPQLPEKLNRLKITIGGALARVDDLRRRQGVHLETVRERARRSSNAGTQARHARVLAEIDAIRAEHPGEVLSSYRLAELMNRRRNVLPPRSLEWNPVSIRWVLKAAGRA